MSAIISKESNNCAVVKITGVLLYKDLETIQNSAKEMFSLGAKVNCLILAEQFSGWGKDGDWGDLTFMYENDSSIGKIAVVADAKKRDELLEVIPKPSLGG
jgi:spore maturation protein SpmB